MADQLVAHRPLTPREREVAWLSAEFTTAEIADRLGISPHTAARHVDAARGKLGVKNKRELPAALRRANYVSDGA